MSGASPEEKAVLEAAGRWMVTYNYNAPPRDKSDDGAWNDLREALRALDAARAPKKPMTAEERADVCVRIRPMCVKWEDAIVIHIREAESAAWDLAIEACAVRVARMVPPTWEIDQSIRRLHGKCHEGGATT